jgi:hypothetical protein
MKSWLNCLNLTSCMVHTILRLEITNQRGVMCQKVVISIYMTSLQITSNISVQNSVLLTSSRTGQYPWCFVKCLVPLMSDNCISFPQFSVYCLETHLRELVQIAPNNILYHNIYFDGFSTVHHGIE